MSAWKHFCTITSHRHKVMWHCFKSGIFLQGIFHDLSKYSPTEFLMGAKFYQGTRSPNEGERDSKGYSTAWMHHKGRNKHHFEYWTDYDVITHVMSPVKIPLNYVIEMFCDRVAASKIYQSDKYVDAHPLEYFNRGKANRIMHKESSDLLESLLIMLANEGEDKTFEYIRKLKRNEEVRT